MLYLVSEVTTETSVSVEVKEAFITVNLECINISNTTCYRSVYKLSYRAETPPQCASESTRALGGYPHHEYRRVTKMITKNVENSTHKTMATAVARIAGTKCDIEKATVSPSALTYAKGAGVEATRHRAFFSLLEGPSLGAHQPEGKEGDKGMSQGLCGVGKQYGR